LGRAGRGAAVLRRDAIALIGGTAVAWPLAARAQQPARYRIGHLAIAAPTDTPPPPPANWDAFVEGLRQAGYMEGSNIAFEHRSAHDQPELFPKCPSQDSVSLLSRLSAAEETA
jgi:putative tryptophan/tyrosine transport system substrate-binding protein